MLESIDPMAGSDELLQALFESTKNRPLKVRELAQYLPTDPPVVSVQLQRLAKDGLVAKVGERGGWYITRKGRKVHRQREFLYSKAIETGGRLFRKKYATILDQEIERYEGLDYGEFLRLGKQAGVPPNLVKFHSEIIWSMEVYLDPALLWRALKRTGLRRDDIVLWFLSWLSLQRIATPKDIDAELLGYQ